MAKKLAIFPCNGNGLEALDCLTDEYEFIGFVDDTPQKQGKHERGFEVFTREILTKYKELYVLAVPGSPASYLKRREHIGSLQVIPERFARVIHPRATVPDSVSIGRNVLIMAGVVVTSNAVIGNHVCVLPNSVIHHDAKVGDYTLVGSAVVIAGYTTIGQNCYIGSGAKIINNISIGENTLVGMGSVVIRNVEPNTKIAGNPARVI